MAHQLTGPVRFRFLQRASDEVPESVEVTLEGDAEWVAGMRVSLELEEVGWVQPLAVSARRRGGEMGEDGEPLGPPGPTPDPSRIPVVRRPIGSLDMEDALEQARWKAVSRPEIDVIEVALNEGEPPVAIPGPTTSDPVAEAWLRRLLDLAVRRHAVTALPLDVIESLLSEKIERSGAGLEAWLDELFRLGKIVRVHGGTRIGYGPSPIWLAERGSARAQDDEDEDEDDENAESAASGEERVTADQPQNASTDGAADQA